MSTAIQSRIENDKNLLQKATTAKAIAESQKVQATEQVAEAVNQMAELQTTPETIAVDIANLEKSLSDDLDKIETLIPIPKV